MILTGVPSESPEDILNKMDAAAQNGPKIDLLPEEGLFVPRIFRSFVEAPHW